MYGDLKDRLRDIEKDGMKDPEKTPKFVVVLSIVLVISVILLFIGGAFVTVKIIGTLQRGFSSDGGSGGILSSRDAGGRSGARRGHESFEYGEVDGCTYYSSFSGLSFQAPSDWNVQSYRDKPLGTRDMSASSRDFSSQVSVSYKPLSLRVGNSDDLLATQKKAVAEVENNTMVDDNIRTEIAGIEFVGLRYMKSLKYKDYYIQTLVAEVKGYALEISAEADTQEELDSITAMFS